MIDDLVDCLACPGVVRRDLRAPRELRAETWCPESRGGATPQSERQCIRLGRRGYADAQTLWPSGNDENPEACWHSSTVLRRPEANLERTTLSRPHLAPRRCWPLREV